MRLLVTGASGFVGRALVEQALERGWLVRAAVRRDVPLPAACEVRVVGAIGPDTEWRDALRGCDAVVHLAARVHVMCDVAADPAAEFERVNSLGTSRLAMQAAAVGVRRFVFASSVKVHGEERSVPYDEQDPAAPEGPYARSKWHAEERLRGVAAQTGLEAAIVRPPLVYGAGVGGNFLEMMRWVQRGVPLPFGSLSNRRSLVAVDNLVDLLLLCARHPAAAHQAFLVSDGDDLSTTELLRRVARALGRPERLWPAPAWLLTGVAAALGRREAARRLCGSLQVRTDKARSMLGWAPIVGVDEALRRTALHFLQHQWTRAASC